MSKKQLRTVIEMQDKFSKELKDLSKYLHNATDDLKKFQQESVKGTNSTGKLAGSLMNLSSIVKTAGIAYLGKKIFDLGTFAVGASSKMKELENVTSQVFNQSKNEIEKWAKDIDDKIGRSIYQMQNFASIYGSMFKGAGFDVSYFKEISKELATLTADFSSFFNVTDEEAFTALKGALTGETEALKRFGIILNDTVMAEYALTKGIKENWAELDVATKMQLRYNKLMETTSFIQGDASRTIDGYANSLKKAEGLIDNIATSLGHRMIPSATKMVHMFNNIAESIDEMLNKKETTEYVFDFIKEKRSIDELKESYVELSKKYLEGLGTPESEKERLELYNRILALYPELIGKIDSEAAAYNNVEKALDGVIAKLKEKTLAQAQEQFLDEQLKTAQKYSSKIVDIQSKLSEKNLKIVNEHKLNADYLLNDKFSNSLGLETDKIKKKKLVEDRLKEAGVQNITREKIEALLDYNRTLYNSKNEVRQIKSNQEFVLKELVKKQSQELESLKSSLNTIENIKLNNSNNEISKIKNSSQSIVKEKEKALNDYRKNENPIATNETEIKSLKDEYKKTKFKTIDDYKNFLKRMVSIGAGDSKEANELRAKISELEKETKKGKSSVKKENIVQWADYQKDIKNTSKYQEAIGANEEDKLKARISIIQSYLRKAIEQGRDDLVEGLKKDLETTEFSLKRISINEALDNIQDDLNKLDIKFKKGEISDEVYHQKSSEILDNIITKYEEHHWELSELDKKIIEQEIDSLKEKKSTHDKEIEAHIEFINKLKKTNELMDSINLLASSLSQLATVTGSKRIGGLSSILQGGLSLGKTFLNLKGGADTLGSLASIAKAGSWFSTAGIAGLGSIVGGVTAGIGIVKTIGSFFGKSGKKKAAEIDNRNAENRDMYKKQVEVMQALTQVLMQNSERIKSFSDRMLTDISKNPTLKNILGGQQNFTTIYDAMIQGKHFNDIIALERGSASYRSGWRRKRKSKDTYTKVNVSEGALLKYLGFDKTELDTFTDAEMRQLQEVLKSTSHSDLVRATGRNLTESNIEEWKKQINEFVNQMNLLEKEKKELFRGSTLESFIGVEYKAEKDLIAEYTEQFKQLGLEGEQYNKTIKEMAKNNQVLITTMQDVRASTIEGLSNGAGGFNTSMKGYFEKIYKNASSVAYDVAFSDMDRYFNDEFKRISEKLVEIKKTGKLDFSNLFAGFDFDKLKLAEANEIQAKKSLDVLKQQLLNSGIDLSIVNKILPQSDFNDRINDLKNSLSSAMSSGLEEHKFDSFTKSLGQSLYDSTKSSLVKAFSESSIYQSMIQKFINVEDFKTKLEKAGSFKDAFTLAEGILKKFGYEMESNGFGGFDAINKINKQENQLGNAYYQDKASNVEIKVTNNFYETVYGVDDLESRILKTVNVGIDTWIKRPKVSS